MNLIRENYGSQSQGSQPQEEPSQNSVSFNSLIKAINSAPDPNETDSSQLELINYDELLDASFSDDEKLESNEETDLIISNLKETRKRRKRATPSEWARQKNFAKREKGADYLGVKIVSTTSSDKENHKSQKFVPREGRQLGKRCSGHPVEGRSEYECDTISEDMRVAIFDKFWKNLTWPQRKVYIPNLVKTLEVQRRRSESWDIPRERSRKYYLKPHLKEVRVCLPMFASTFGISAETIKRWTFNDPTANGNRKSVEVSGTNNTVQPNRKAVSDFLQSLPILPSHYCRQNSSKRYLEPSIQSQNQLFSMYQASVSSEKLVSRWTFFDEFKTQNFSIHQPKKDQCNDCVKYKNGNLSKEEYENHILQKDRARSEKSKDKKLAQKRKLHLITMDVQALQQSPVLNAGAGYFKSKLNIHNYTIYDVATKNVSCYWWTETESDLSASAFVSCLIDYCKLNYCDNLPIVIFSDGCTCQNRNAVMSNALLNLSIKSNKIIIQKFLVKGHTQMEADSVHSSIESKKKGKEIFLPSDYIKITREARTNPRPYNAVLLTHEFFQNYSHPSLQYYKSIRPGKNVGDPVVVDIRALKYDPRGTIHFKIDFDEEWKELPGEKLATKPQNVEKTLPLHTSQIPISSRKYLDLISLKPFIPHDCHDFYNNLPHK